MRSQYAKERLAFEANFRKIEAERGMNHKNALHSLESKRKKAAEEVSALKASNTEMLASKEVLVCSNHQMA